MSALHYYIKNQSRQLRDEIERISELLAALENQKNKLYEETYKNIKQVLHDFNLRKQIELLNFNKQLIKKRFILDEKAEEERIHNDIVQLNYLRLEWPGSTANIEVLIKSLEEHKTHFVSDGIGTRIFNVSKKAIGFTGESWEAARGSVAASSKLLSEIGPAISGVFDSITLVGETVVNFDSGIEAAEKYDIGAQLFQAKDNEIALEALKEKHHLSDKKINKYKTTDINKRDLLNKKNYLQLNRAATGFTNGTLGIFGIISCSTTMGIGIISLLQAYGVIALPAATLGTLSLAAAGLSIVGPLSLTAIFANKFLQNRIEYDVQKKVRKAAKDDFTTLRNSLYPDKTIYKKLKTTYETSLHQPKKISDDETHKNFLKVYEKENIYRKEKQKLKSIGVEKVFSTIELGASLFAVTGSLLLAITTGALSFGIAPTVVLVTGSAIALGAAAFEYIDKKNGHKYSDYLSNKWKQFKNWAWPDDAGEKQNKKIENRKDKTNQKADISKLKETAVSLLPDYKNSNEFDLNRLDTIYDQLQGKEQKTFRQAAWKKMETMAFATPNEKLAFLVEARKHSVFNKHRGFGLFSRTSTVEKIDKSIADTGHEIYNATSADERRNQENNAIRQQYLYRPHR